MVPTFSPGTENSDERDDTVEALNYFAKLFRVVLALRLP